MSGQLKEVRDRMKSVRSTQQITKAMKMVSAAKLRRAQDAIVQMRPYANKLGEILKHILSNVDTDVSNVYSRRGRTQKAMVIVITSNRGLCGAFNANIVKAAVKRIDDRYSKVREAGGLTILCIGKRGHDYFRKRYTDCNIIDSHVNLFSDLSFSNISKVADWVMESFAEGDFDAIDVGYGQFKNPGTQFAELVNYLPVPIEAKKVKSRRADYIFEPDEDKLLRELIPSILQVQFQKFLLDTQASEHGARMTAMDKATENAEEMLRELRIGYNKARQETITKELSEIVGGAAAV